MGLLLSGLVIELVNNEMDHKYIIKLNSLKQSKILIIL